MSTQGPVAVDAATAPTAHLDEKHIPSTNGTTTGKVAPPAAASKKTSSESLGTLSENPIIVEAKKKEKATGKRYTVFEKPGPGSKPLKRAELTAPQKEKYEQMLKHFQELKEVPVSSARGAATKELEDHERMFLTKECFERYLRATKWNVPGAIKRLEETLVWRREFGADRITAEQVEIENETGKEWIVGYDIHGRPCLALNPARQNTEESPRQIQHLVFMLERSVDLMPPGQDTLALLIDFNESTNKKNPSVATGRKVLNILQNHYPERLGRALVVNIPWFVWAFLKLVNPFIDPLTREKIVYNDDLRKYVPPAQLEKRFGGDLAFEYDHSVYWTHLLEASGRSRQAYIQRWIDRGKRVGDSELALRGGEDPEVSLPAVENLKIES